MIQHVRSYSHMHKLSCLNPFDYPPIYHSVYVHACMYVCTHVNAQWLESSFLSRFVLTSSRIGESFRVSTSPCFPAQVDTDPGLEVQEPCFCSFLGFRV